MAVDRSVLAERLSAAGQEQLLRFEQKLSGEERGKLFAQLAELDFPSLNSLFATATQKHHEVKAGTNAAEAAAISPPTAVQTLDALTLEELGRLEKCGREALAAGKVAAVCLGGGAGTRLGLDGPKGLFAVPGLPSQKSLFQLFAERLLSLKRSTNAKHLPLLVMTSPLNHEVTKAFFEEHHFFGLSAQECFFFPQGTLPAFDFAGKILLETRDSVSLSPDGNGGIYPALERSGLLRKMEKDFGVEYLHVFGVDNILARPCDPLFVGYCLDEDIEIGNKSVWKADPEEKVGVVAQKNGKYCVIEYSELSEGLKTQTDPATQKLSFGAGNICNHLFKLSFLKEKVLPNMANSYHVAEKKIPVPAVGEVAGEGEASPDLDEGKVCKKPEQNNGIKLETFIFDVFELTEKFAVLECRREEEFAPIKNASGADSPDSALKMLSRLHKQWIEQAGGQVAEGVEVVEVSPLVSYGGEGLEGLCSGKVFGEGAEVK